MTNPVLQLKDLLSEKKPRATGIVLSVSTVAAQIRLSSGVVSAALNFMVPVSVGDEVVVSNGAIQAKIKPSSQVTTYSL